MTHNYQHPEFVFSFMRDFDTALASRPEMQ
jgi:hypothetical protein